MITKGNIFFPPDSSFEAQEVFETLLEGKMMQAERIVTLVPYHNPGEWYDQERGEWVLLLRGSATIEFQNGGSADLQEGDYLFIPAHEKHRVAKTSAYPACVWLAIHGDLTPTCP